CWRRTTNGCPKLWATCLVYSCLTKQSLRPGSKKDCSCDRWSKTFANESWSWSMESKSLTVTTGRWCFLIPTSRLLTCGPKVQADVTPAVSPSSTFANYVSHYVRVDRF